MMASFSKTLSKAFRKHNPDDISCKNKPRSFSGTLSEVALNYYGSVRLHHYLITKIPITGILNTCLQSSTSLPAAYKHTLLTHSLSDLVHTLRTLCIAIPIVDTYLLY